MTNTSIMTLEKFNQWIANESLWYHYQDESMVESYIDVESGCVSKISYCRSAGITIQYSCAFVRDACDLREFADNPNALTLLSELPGCEFDEWTIQGVKVINKDGRVLSAGELGAELPPRFSELDLTSLLVTDET